MARVAFLLPREDMLPLVREVIQQQRLDVVAIQAVHTSEILDATRQVMEQGADIVVARGLQAAEIKAHLPIPLVAIQFTAQEIGLMVEKARAIAGKPAPIVGVVGYRNMFQDISHLEELLHVKMVIRYVEQDQLNQAAERELLVQAAEQAAELGADVLIGGDVVCQYATDHGLPSVFPSLGRESIENACRSTRQLAYALDLEKRVATEFRIILDYTVSGLILIDGAGIIRQTNHSAEQLLDGSQQTAVGTPIWEVFPTLTLEALSPVLQQGNELSALHLKRDSAQYLATISPVTPETGALPSGAVISITDSQQLKSYADRQRRELFRQGFVAPYTFSTLIARSPQMQTLVERAKHCARFSAPVIIQGEFGTEKEELAQCIHNASDNAENAFLHFNCGSMSPEAAEARLFGPHGLVEQAQGILFLDEISQLSPAAQYQLYRLISGRPDSISGSFNAPPAPIQILAGTSQDLQELTASGAFRADLYYSLNVTTLVIPPLRERREDILLWAEYFLNTYQTRYGRYIHFTRSAWQRLRDYSWPGNLSQLRSVCQQAVVSAPKRTVDEFFLDARLGVTVSTPAEAKTPDIIYRDPNAARIYELLEQYHGNRNAVAQALSISTTTLWRRMKKYGVQY